MLYTIAIEPGDEQHAYGVIVPDIPGCFSGGDTLDEAYKNAKEAIELHLEGLAEDRDKLPEAQPIDIYANDPEYQGFIMGVIEIDIAPYLGKSKKINVTLPEYVIKQIDRAAETSPSYRDRSNFLLVASLHELSQTK
ncbi:type II toxin-antitoxin system HicB family antitoxin [Dongshaea marina]|uniref:type II toxin-antitoxin system HicB family antitoxin n=1 Tax=Dongshaea marina TaxID=2047966 RepID=UPI000D3E1C10|nr:type II toxin-antitoxin system HicB family antitoxin [Dongshaea marina]